jgi:hypothetical protein
MALFISVISIVIYNFAFIQPQFNNLDKIILNNLTFIQKNYDYNPNISWINGILTNGLAAQTVDATPPNPPPKLPHA